jgi:hypothetical protein
MGHTVWSQRITLDVILGEMKDYRKALAADDRAVFEQMMKGPLKHYGSISYAGSFHAWAFLLLSIMLEQEKRLRRLEYEGMADGCVQEEELDSAVAQDA